MATERYHRVVEWFSVHAGDRHQQIGRWRHEKPGSALTESLVLRTRYSWTAKSVVQPNSICFAACGYVWDSRPWDVQRPRAGGTGPLLIQEHHDHRAGWVTVPSGVLQRAQSRKFRHSERDRLF